MHWTVLPLASGNEQTLNSLRDPERRPTVPRALLPPGVLHHIPDEEIDLDQERFLANLRSARRGAAGGPSGMTAERLKVALESERESRSLWRCAKNSRGVECLPKFCKR